jgi:alkylation response protein AidB-like acyl-CoA dehydrogenase
MDFDFTDEQRMLGDSVARFGDAHYNFATWRARALAGGPADRGGWRKMAELGWLALTLPEAHGGVGGGPVDTMIVMEGLGRHLMLEPYVGACVIAPFLLSHMPDAAERLAAIASGRTVHALADAEPCGRFESGFVATSAEPTADGVELTGEKSHVLDGGIADAFIIPARVSGPPGERAGISLFLVPKDAPGLTVSPFRAIDHRINARLRLDRVNVSAGALIGPAGAAFPLIERALDLAICARLAEAVGAMSAVLERTLAHLGTRRQFGKAIGEFQVLQHRAVDMAIACEEARSMCYLATLSLDAPDAERRRVIAAAKARVGQTGLFVGRQAVQLHGGVGFSDELDVSHFLKRLIMIDMSFGNADHHRAVFARLPFPGGVAAT